METTLIIIPTYNEIENIESFIEAVFLSGLTSDVLVVDDQSPDGTADQVLKMIKKFPKVRKLIKILLENLFLLVEI